MSVGIHGFGRIGKLVLRACMDRGIPVNLVNASRDEYELAYMSEYDSVHGRMPANVIPGPTGSGYVNIGENLFSVTSFRDPNQIPWGTYGVQVVVDCTGKNTTLEKANQHLLGGASKVLISSPEKDPQIPMFVFGVNSDKLTSNVRVASAASCTTNCVAPMAKVLSEAFGIESALLTTIHAVTNSQSAVDGHNTKDPRLGRSLFNIIPTSTGAADALVKVMPDLHGKVTGMAFRVPIPDVSVVDFSVKLGTDIRYEEICEAMRYAASNQFKGIIQYVDAPVVSSDFLHCPYTCAFDSRAGIMLKEHQMAKLIAWYDNEWGYVSQLVSLLELML